MFDMFVSKPYQYEPFDTLGFIARHTDVLRSFIDQTTPECSASGNPVHPVLKRHGDHIVRHFVNAERKHAGFAYGFLSSDQYRDNKFAQALEDARERLAKHNRQNDTSAKDVLDCEVAELYEAMIEADPITIAEEAYDCIAVLLRIIDRAEHGVKFMDKLPSSDGETETTNTKE